MYGAKLWFGIVCGALLATVGFGRPAAAVEWDLDEYTSNWEWQLTFDADGSNDEDVQARGYYIDGSGDFARGWVRAWDGGGIGVGYSGDTDWPEHGVDNHGNDNFLLLEFDDPNYLLSEFQIGWSYDDSDIEVWVGGNDLAAGFNLSNYEYDDLDDLGFTKVDVYYNVVVGAWTQVNTDVTGRYAIFAGEYGEWDDHFKLSAIRGIESFEVPEPGSMLILGSALAMLGGGALRRRRQRPTQAA